MKLESTVKAYGRLISNPHTTTSDKGTLCGLGCIAINLPCRDEKNSGLSFLVSILAFSETAEVLSKAEKGDLIQVSGKIRTSIYEDKDGVKRKQPQILANNVIRL